MALNVLGFVELSQDRLGQDLPKFNTHLICRRMSNDRGVGPPLSLTERVDAPDDTLREDLVLVERNERTEGSGGKEREDDAVARTVALEHLALDERLARVRAELSAHLLLALAKRERLGLREKVGEQDAVVQRVADRVVRRRRRDEVGRDQLRALVNKLVERVLAVGTRGAPDDRLEHVQNDDVH